MTNLEKFKNIKEFLLTIKDGVEIVDVELDDEELVVEYQVPYYIGIMSTTINFNQSIDLIIDELNDEINYELRRMSDLLAECENIIYDEFKEYEGE